MNKNKKTLILLVSLGLIALGISSFNGKKSEDVSYFSATSLVKLQNLSKKHQVYIENLLGNPGQQLDNDLFQANIFGSETTSNFDGLIASTTDRNRGQTNVLKINTKSELTNKELQEIAIEYKNNISEFSSVEIDQKISLFTSGKTAPTATRRARVNTANKTKIIASNPKNDEKKIIKIALIDSGVDLNHELFKGKHLETGLNLITNSNNMYDDIGHGTHLAGIIAANSPQADIIPYKVIDKNDGRLSTVIAALKRAMDDHVEIVNMSFGVKDNSEILEKVIQDLTAKNIIVVAAAGNNNDSTMFYPAAYANVIAVAAVDEKNNKLKNSAYGDWVDVATVGYQIVSSLPDNTYGRKNGTSQSTAILSAYLINKRTLWPDLHSTENIKKFFSNSANKKGTDLLAGVPILSIPIVTEF